MDAVELPVPGREGKQSDAGGCVVDTRRAGANKRSRLIVN